MRKNRCYTIILIILGLMVNPAIAQSKFEMIRTAQAKAGQPVPDALLKDSEGKELRLSDYRGKILIVDVWASWCLPCLKGMPDMDKLANKNKDEVVLLAVCSADKKEHFEGFVRENHNRYNFKFAFDPNGVSPTEKDFRGLYGINGFPTTMVIDRNGNLVGYGNGVEETEKHLDVAKQIPFRNGKDPLRIVDEPYRPLGWDKSFYGKTAPEFQLKTPGGSILSSKGLRGKFIVLDFWATWCIPCRELTHQLDSALRKYPATQLQTIAINHQENIIKGGNARAYWKKSGYHFPMAVDEEYPKKFQAGFPTTVVISPEGKIIGYFSGLTPTTAGEVDAIIWKAINKPIPSLATIKQENDKGEYIKALMLNDQLTNDPAERTDALRAQRLRSLLHTNPWMGLNVAKAWVKSSGENKLTLLTIGKLIGDAGVQEKDIREYGMESIRKANQ